MASFQHSSIEELQSNLLSANLSIPLDLTRGLDSVTLAKFQSLFVTELPAENTAAIHGASLGAIQDILKVGTLSACQISTKNYRGFLEVEPIIRVIENHAEARNALKVGYAHFSDSPNEYHGYAEVHAGLQAKSNALIRIFGLNPKSEEDYLLVLRLVDSTPSAASADERLSAIQILGERGYFEKQVNAAVDFVDTLNGFCIGLKPEVFTFAKYSEVASDGKVPRLKVPKGGIPLDLISGILPEGDFEKQLVRRIKML